MQKQNYINPHFGKGEKFGNEKSFISNHGVCTDGFTDRMWEQ